MAQKCTHREYYAQFVTPDRKAAVERVIGKERLLTSTDPHFNDIPMHIWDSVHQNYQVKGLATLWTADGENSIRTGACIAKEAARQIVDEARSTRRKA